MSQSAQAPSSPVSLRFTPDGQRVVVSSDSGVRLIDVAGQQAAIRLLPQHASDLIAFDTEIWLVQGEPPELLRFNLVGSPLGEPTPLPPGPGRLMRSPFGDPVAVWMAEVPTLLAGSEGGVTQSTLPRADLVLPLSARRWLSVEGPRVTLREPGDELWTSPHVGDDMRAIYGAPLFDARALALLCESRDHSEHQILVLSTRDGGLQHRIALTGTTLVRFAPRRGYALVLSGLRKLTALDLRFGKVVKEFDETRDVVDVAIDDLAQHLAMRLRGDDGEIETVHTTYRDLLAAAPHEPAASSDGGPASNGGGNGASASASANGAAATSPATPTARTLPVVPRVERKREPPPPRAPEPQPTGELEIPEQFLALNPRPLTQRCSRAESFMLLERYLALVGAWCERAIATAWDRGRLTYPNEGRLPFETEVAGILGRERNHAQPQPAAAQAHVVEAAAAVRDAELQVSGRLTPLGSLAREFGLSPLAYEILMIVAAPTLWGELSRLYGILANDPDRPLCDELLVCQILSGRAERHDIARELDRDRPLYRYGLVRPGDGRVRPFISLATDPLVIRQLRAESMDGDPGETISVRVADRTLHEIRMPELTKRELLTALARAPESHVRIAVQGRIGSGRRTLLAALAAHANRNLGVIDASLLSRDPKARLESLRVALRRVVLRGWIPCVEGLDDVASDDQATREQLRELFRSHPGPLALRLSWDAQPPLDPGYLKVDLPPLKDHERIEVWRAVTDRHGLLVKDVEDIALRYRVGAGVIEKVAAAVARAGDSDARRPPANDIRPPDNADRGRELDLALRQHLETRLGQTATRVTRLATWSDTVLPTDVLDSLFELIARIRHRRTVYDAWGFDRTMTTSRGLTALFQGGPGTGKSMVAGVIASELGLDLYRVDLSRIMSKWIGETERNLASVFDAAEDGQAIILFDEADSLFAKRTEVRSSVDRYANLEVNYLLQRLDTFEGIALLTTNFGGSIDSAFKRRLSLRLTFPFPDEEMREQLWRVHLPPEMPTAGDFDLAALARKFQLSGGYIRNATLRAAFLAAEEHSPLTQDHLERAIRLEYREMGKLGDTGVLE